MTHDAGYGPMSVCSFVCLLELQNNFLIALISAINFVIVH